MSNPKAQVIIIDNKEPMRKSVCSYATDKLAWNAFESRGVNIPEEINPKLPTLVLLSHRLGRNNPKKWLENFRNRYPQLKPKVFLLTKKAVTEKLRAFATQEHLDGILQKPLDLERLPDLLKYEAPAPALSHAENSTLLLLKNVIDKLELAIRILDRHTLQPVYENPAAKQYSLGKDSLPSLQALKKQLENNRRNSIENWEWDAENKQWLRRRLFQSGNWYCLTEIRSTDNFEHPPSTPLSLFQLSNRVERLERLADILKRQWGITRIRLYQITPLYDTEPLHHLLQPLWQQGKGFDASSNSNEEKWKNTEVLLDELTISKKIFSEKKPIIRPASDKSLPIFPHIGWGTGENQAKNWVDIPIFEGIEKNQVIGIIALDRRRDHLLQLPHWASDAWSTEITRADTDFMAGFLWEMNPILSGYIRHCRDELHRQWEKELTRILQDSLTNEYAHQVITRVLSEVQTAWKLRRGISLQDLFLVQTTPSNDLLEAWAGVGTHWEIYRQQRLFSPVYPFSQSLKKTTVIHSKTQLSVEQQQEMATVFPTFVTSEQVWEDLNSWLGIPIKQGEETLAILVIQVARDNYFTQYRVEALEATAQRLVPLVLWGRTQSQMGWFSRALVHEFRQPLNWLTWEIEEPSEGEMNRDKIRAMCEYLNGVVSNLKYLQQPVKVVSASVTEVTDLGQLVKEIQRTLRLVQDNYLVEVDSTLKPRIYQVPVPKDTLHQILFNLLENACKYNSVPTAPVQVKLAEDSHSRTLQVTISNVSYKYIPEEERERLFKPYYRASNAGGAGGSGIGLTVVRRLSESYGLTCWLSEPGHAGETNTRVSFSLQMSFNNVEES